MIKTQLIQSVDAEKTSLPCMFKHKATGKIVLITSILEGVYRGVLLHDDDPSVGLCVGAAWGMRGCVLQGYEPLKKGDSVTITQE